MALFMVELTGVGCARGDEDVRPFLRSPKMLKFMGKQDRLAVIAAKRAVGERPLPELTGIYLAVGTIPFDLADLEPLARESVSNERFCMQAFSTRGLDQVNPLLTFRCLPNMPAFHVSLNLAVQGPYWVSYPGVGQFYQGLEQAVADLEAGAVDAALVGGVCDRDNFLVSTLRGKGLDTAGFLRLERDGGRPLEALELAYRPGAPPTSDEHGPGALAFALADGANEHEVQAADGIWGRSRWR